MRITIDSSNSPSTPVANYLTRVEVHFDSFEILIAQFSELFNVITLDNDNDPYNISMLSKKNIPQRAVVYPKDVENITGRSGRTAQAMLQNIRKVFGKNKTQFVTVAEFCYYTGLDEESVREFIQD